MLLKKVLCLAKDHIILSLPALLQLLGKKQKEFLCLEKRCGKLFEIMAKLDMKLLFEGMSCQRIPFLLDCQNRKKHKQALDK